MARPTPGGGARGDAAAWWSSADAGIMVSVRVMPGARKSELVEVAADRLRVRIAAPPVEGKANAELCRFVARLFGVRRTAVTVVRGERSRDKVLRVDGLMEPPDLDGTA